MRGKASHGEAAGGKWKGSSCQLQAPAQPPEDTRAASQAVMQEWKDSGRKGRKC